MIYREPGFLATYWFYFYPPSPVSKPDRQSVPPTLESWGGGTHSLAGGGGHGSLFRRPATGLWHSVYYVPTDEVWRRKRSSAK